MVEDKKLIVICPISSDKYPLDADFYSLLSFIKSEGINHQWLILNLEKDSDDYFKEISGTVKNEVVYLYISNIGFLNRLKKVLLILREFSPLIIMGGESAITIKAAEILDSYNEIDAIVKTPEDENALSGLVKELWGNRDWRHARGIIFRHPGTKDIVKTKSIPLPKNIGYLSSRGIFENKIPGYEWYPVITSRGCNQNCQYCGFHVPYRENYPTAKKFWRKKTGKQLVDEIEYLSSQGLRKFTFRCNQFFAPLEQAEESGNAVEIAQEILNRRLKIKFKFSSKPSEIRRNFDSLMILKEAGLDLIDIGIDSGIERFHQIYETGSTVSDSVEILRQLHEYHINFDIGFIFYEPYLDCEGIRTNINFLEKIAGYFTHLPSPFSAYLDSRVLNSVLILRWGMPIIQKLKQDNLVVEYPDFSKQPSARFMHSETTHVYSIYRALNERALPLIRPFFYNKELVERFDFINLFPLRLLAKILALVSEERFPVLSDYIQEVETFIKETFRPEIGKIFSIFGNSKNERLEAWISHSSN